MVAEAINEGVEDKGEVVKEIRGRDRKEVLQIEVKLSLTDGSLTPLPSSLLYLGSAQHSRTMLSSSFR